MHLTPENGRIAAFDVAARGADAVVVARDDDEPREGAGGSLVRVLLHDGAREPAAVVARRVGHSLPDILRTEGDGAPWLSFTDPADHALLLPPAGDPSPEPLLDPARPLLLVSPASPPAGSSAPSAPTVLIAADSAAGTLRRLSCQP